MIRTAAVGLALGLSLVTTACGSRLGDGAAPASPGSSAPVGATPALSSSPLAGVESHQLTARGDWVWVSRGTDTGGFGTTELWAADLIGRPAQLVLRYPRSWIGETFVSRQLSRDGAHFGFSTDVGGGRYRIVVADVRGGTWRTVDPDTSEMQDGHPTWSPDGSRLAFSRMTRTTDGRTVQAGLWVVNADGSSLHKLLDGASAPTYVYDWTPDGRFVGVAQNVGYSLVDASTGAIRSSTNIITAGSWRAREPAFVGAMSGQGSEITIATGPGPDALGPAQLRVSAPVFISRPRWNPVRDEFLYLRSAPAAQPNIPDLTVQVRSGELDRAVPLSGRPGYAEWAPDGESIVYLRSDVVADPTRPGSGGLFETSLRVVRRDGSADHEIFASNDAQGRPLSLAGDFATRHY